MEQTLTDLIPLKPGERLCIIGSGGKTTLLNLLAATCAGQSVLVVPTTKMGYSQVAGYDVFLDGYAPGKWPEIILPKLYLAGKIRPDKGGERKLCALESSVLNGLHPLFETVIMEADGARERPLKGWAQYEPVIPGFTTATILVIPVWPVGYRAEASLIHRLPLFCEASGVQAGEVLRLEHLAALVAHPKGPFKQKAGRRIILINQLDCWRGTPQQRLHENNAALAHDFPKLLPESFLCTLDCIIAGSTSLNRGIPVWKK